MPTNSPNLPNVGSKRNEFVKVEALNAVEKLGIDFRLKCIELLNQRGVTASGKLEDSISQPIIVTEGSKITMTIKMADYYDYTNKGVKGWADSSRAPNSPYQFKTKGMDDEGKKSIEEYIRSGRKKITTFSQSYKEMETKLKRRNKGNQLFEFAVKNTIFGIKKKGIRAKHWFDDAVKEVFGDVGQVMAEAYGRDITVTFTSK